MQVVLDASARELCFSAVAQKVAAMQRRNAWWDVDCTYSCVGGGLWRARCGRD